MQAERKTLSYFLDGIRGRDRVVLSQAITLLESTRQQDQNLAADLLDQLSLDEKKSFRIAVTGVPGAGKSTLIETLGRRILDRGRSVAVLAIDPSSHVSGGSILGDKTRMPTLSVSPDAFVRPSPTRGSLGGLASATPESIALCEAAGFDVIFVETVGVGQAEIDAADVADVVIVVLIGGAGDELQGIKRGILEAADIIAVNKADGANEQSALAARTTLRSVIGLLPSVRPSWNRPVVACSATTGSGVDELSGILNRYEEQMHSSGYIDNNRREQTGRRFDELVQRSIWHEVESVPQFAKTFDEAAEAIRAGKTTPLRAVATVRASLRELLNL